MNIESKTRRSHFHPNQYKEGRINFSKVNTETTNLIVTVEEDTIIVSIERDSPNYNHSYTESISASVSSENNNLEKLKDACETILSLIDEIQSK